MFEEIFTSGALNFVYAAAVIISFIFAIISLLGTEIGDAVDIEADIDSDSGIDFISISPFALAMFGAAFGLTGLITRLWFDMPAVPSLVVASMVGLLIGVLAQALFLYVFAPSKSSHFSLVNDAVGRDAQVIVTVPNEGLGTIAYDNVSGRVTLGARSMTGKQIFNGETVVIEGITGRVALVRPFDDAVFLKSGKPDKILTSPDDDALLLAKKQKDKS